MKISAQALKDKAKNMIIKSNGNITVQEIIQNYMFERLLERLSISEYKNNLILKGGLLLSSIIGIDFRTTLDMDTCLKGIALTYENLSKIITNIIKIKIDDNIIFELLDTDSIKQQDEYGGYRFNIIAYLENLKVNLSIDICTRRYYYTKRNYILLSSYV